MNDFKQDLLAPIKTWRQRIGADTDFPLHAPTDVERAMEAEIAELRDTAPVAWRQFVCAIADLPAGAEVNIAGMRRAAMVLLAREYAHVGPSIEAGHDDGEGGHHD